MKNPSLTCPFREGDNLVVVNQYGETYRVSVTAVMPTTGGRHRLTVATHGLSSDATYRFNCYTDDPEMWAISFDLDTAIDFAA